MLYSILWQAVLNFSVSPVPIFEHMFTLIFVFMRILSKISVNLYKEYTSLKSRELEELPHFWVMSWQLF